MPEVNIGAAPNDGTGDPLRFAFNKLNQNDQLHDNEIAGLKLTDARLALAVRDGAIIPLTNIAGNGDIITADIQATFIAAGITTLSAIAEVEYVPVMTNAAANPTITIAGITYGIRDANGASWLPEAFTVGRSYKLRRSGTIMRVSTGAVTIADMERQIRDTGDVHLQSVGGTPNAITALLPKGYSTALINSARLLLRPTAENTVSGPTLSISGGEARTLADHNNNNIPAGFLKVGRRYILRPYSNNRWNITETFASQQDATTNAARMTTLEQQLQAAQADIALHDTVRTPIPMNATWDAANSRVALTPVSPLWPVNSNGYDYEFDMPIARLAGSGLSVYQGGDHSRTIAGATGIDLDVGDRVRYTITGNRDGLLRSVSLTPAKLQMILAAVKSAPQVVQQMSAAMPPRPPNASVVIWQTWDNPGTNRKVGDIWLDEEFPDVPPAPAGNLFYLRPTLGSAALSLVVRGIKPVDYRPVLTGINVVVGAGEPEIVAPTSPATIPLPALPEGTETTVQIALSNLAGTGAYSPLKYVTPAAASVFQVPMTPRVAGVPEGLRGSRGFKNLARRDSNGALYTLNRGDRGLGPTSPNDAPWAQTDVGGLNGDNLYAQCDIASSSSSSTAPSSAAMIMLGLNNAWAADPNDIETQASPNGVFLVVRTDLWRLISRAGGTETILATGALSSLPTSMRIERRGANVRGFVNGVQVVSQDVNPALFTETEGVTIGNYRPSGGGTIYLMLRNFEAGKL